MPESFRRPALWHRAADLGAASTAASSQTGAAYRTEGRNIFRRSEILVLFIFARILFFKVCLQTATTKIAAKTTRNFSQEDFPSSSLSTHFLPRFTFFPN